MSESPSLSRRRALQLFAGAPLLPLGSSLAGLSLTAEAAAGAHFKPTYTFGAMAAPSLADAAQMATTYVASTLTRKARRGPGETFRLGYEAFFLTGQALPDGKGGTTLAGAYYDILNRPIMDTSGASPRQFFSDCPDGMSLIELHGARSRRHGCHRLFAVVQFEYATKNLAGQSMYGQLPSPMAVLTLDQDKRTGKLSVVGYSNVDTSGVEGLWITCGASRSPWNTHLASEEYEPDATLAVNAQLKGFSKNLYGDENRANPYHYGHMPEVTVHPDGTGRIKKHFGMGRISHELVEVMPDRRTVLMGDDTTNGGLFMFIADNACDLSSGTLYVAKWMQTSAADGGSADLRWVNLGHATSAEIRTLADQLKAADIVEVKTTDPQDASYTKIPYSGKTNWVKFKPGMDKAAAFLETHRYAAYRGGSLGFTKMEGTAVNARDKVAYSAISYVQSAMTNGSGGIAIQGPNAGMVYAWKLDGNQLDDLGQAIASEWVPVSGAPLLLGEDLAIPDALGNLAHAEKIANPDNLKFSEKLRTLFIGEDSGMHVNNFLWAYNVDTKSLARILSTPSGAESTGLHAVDEVNGFSYIMSNFQHPGDWDVKRDAAGNVTGGLHAKVFQALEPLEQANYNGKFSAAVGYMTMVGRVED